MYRQIATTGGFGIGQEVGVATTGSGREPINAWLPLYIHAQHWEIIKINLRQILGYVYELIFQIVTNNNLQLFCVFGPSRICS